MRIGQMALNERHEPLRIVFATQSKLLMNEQYSKLI